MEERLPLFRSLLADAQAIRPALPALTFEDQFVLAPGRRDNPAAGVGRGHTRGDVIVHLPERKVLIVGDLITHPLPAATEAFPVEWIDALRRIESLEYDFLVPGHGPVLEDRTYLQEISRLLESVVSQVRRSVAQGLDLEATIESVDVGDLRDSFVGKSPGDEQAFERWFLDPAVRSAFSALSSTP